VIFLSNYSLDIQGGCESTLTGAPKSFKFIAKVFVLREILVDRF
jgi:hypothetical protein